MTFLWGAATAAHQIEGGNVGNDCWAAEQASGLFAEPSGAACDSFHRYPEDVRLVAGLGLDAYRFSLEWSRIEPAEGEFSASALDHYRRMVDCCRDTGIEPVVTLHHFTSPQWLGGWRNPRVVDRFVRYVEAVRPVLRDVRMVCTINEPNVLFSVAHALVGDPEPDPAVRDHLRSAHDAAVEILRGDHEVGLTLAMRAWHAVDGGEERLDQLRRHEEDRWLQDLTGDFVGVQAYTGDLVGPDGVVPLEVGAPRTLTGWRVDPGAVGVAVRRAAALTGLPVYVTENGIATDSDQVRTDYLHAALDSLAKARQDGVDVRGYFAWSLLDNFEWMLGYAPTFGLVAVDRVTFTRVVKPSGQWFADEVRRRRRA